MPRQILVTRAPVDPNCVVANVMAPRIPRTPLKGLGGTTVRRASPKTQVTGPAFPAAMGRKGMGRLVLLVLVTVAAVLAGCSHGDDGGSDGDGGGPYVETPSTAVEDAPTAYPQADGEVKHPGPRR